MRRSSSTLAQFTQREQIGSERFEFQMLYGVRRDLQARLKQAGFNMRVYIPFGSTVVSLPDAAAGGAARQYCVHPGKSGERVDAGAVRVPSLIQ